MIAVQRLLHRLARDERGLSTVEYVIVLALIAGVSVGVWNQFGGKIKDYTRNSKNQIDGEMPGWAKGK